MADARQTAGDRASGRPGPQPRRRAGTRLPGGARQCVRHQGRAQLAGTRSSIGTSRRLARTSPRTATTASAPRGSAHPFADRPNGRPPHEDVPLLGISRSHRSSTIGRTRAPGSATNVRLCSPASTHGVQESAPVLPHPDQRILGKSASFSLCEMPADWPRRSGGIGAAAPAKSRARELCRGQSREACGARAGGRHLQYQYGSPRSYVASAALTCALG